MAEETDRIPLRQYLLGELPPEERESVEERVFIDETLSEQVREVETELITDYLQGRLGTAEREHFEKNFCTTDARRQLVELTDSVLQAAQPGQYPIQSTAAHSASFGRAPWAAMAASILIALGLAGYTVYSLRTERAASQRRAEDLEQRLAQLQVPTVQPISFLLSATATRTAGESSGPLVIPSTASSVTLEVFPELKGYPSWSLTLENVAGQQLWSGMATASGSKQTVSANVPASVLDAGPKTARLHGLDPQGKSVLAGVYVFTVARR